MELLNETSSRREPKTQTREVTDIKAYVKELLKINPSFRAVKTGFIAVKKVEPGTEINTWTANGNLEAPEVASEGVAMAVRVDNTGKPVIDKYGHKNAWFIPEATLEKMYDEISSSKNDIKFYKPKQIPQDFIKINENIKFNMTSGPDKTIIPMTLLKDSVLNITDMDSIYGIAPEEFSETYKIISEN